MKKPTVWEQLATVELDYPIRSIEEIVQFRLELFGAKSRRGNLKKFRIRAFRYDLFLLKPSFGQSRTKVSRGHFDHEWAIIDPFLDNFEIWAVNRKAALKKGIDRLTSQLLGDPPAQS
jgi:hypothetical protein